MSKKDYGLSIAFLLLGIGILSIFFPFDILDGKNWGKYQINIGNYSELGEFISGVTAPFLSAAAFVLLYKTYKSQMIELAKSQEILKHQNSVISKQQFETTFYNLLDVYNKSVEQMKITKTKTKFTGKGTEKTVSNFEGKECFTIMYNRFREIHSVIIPKLGDKKNQEIIDVIYNEFYLEYESRLGHYFRILYHIIRFVDSSEIKNKKDYTNILRAQFSSYESLLLCFNCISRFGFEKFMPLVDKYSLLKHIAQNDELLRYDLEDIINDEAFEKK